MSNTHDSGSANDGGSGWVVFHDLNGGWIHLVLADNRDDYWSVVRLDEEVSDPDGNFLVFVSDLTNDDLRISIRTIGEDHIPAALHEDFNAVAFGGPTLNWGEITNTMWWTSSPWYGDRPTIWRPSSLATTSQELVAGIYLLGAPDDRDLVELDED